MKICCFGASVTAQKDGYVKHLRNLLPDEYNVIQNGYGGEHLFPSAICHLENIIEQKPDLCILDWFSTGFIMESEKTIDAINAIIYQLRLINCKIIFLFMPRIDNSKRISFYKFIENYLNKINISYIDLNKTFSNLDLILRDVVHTNLDGSKLYAEEINKQLKNLDIKTPIYLEKNKYCTLKTLDVNKIVNNKIELSGNATILCFSLIIGPESGYINIVEQNKKLLLWDEWCHYNRQSTNINNIKVSNQLTIEVLNAKVDYSKCRREFNPENVKFNLNIKNIYYYDG